MAQGIHVFTYTDYGGEKSAVRIRGVELTSANYDAQIAASVALQDTIAALVIGLKGQVQYSNLFEISGAKATDPYAQRESKWLVRYHDNVTGDKQTLEIPTAKLALLGQDTEFLDLSGTEAANFKTAFEGFAKSKNGNAVTIDQILFVARGT